MVCLPFISRIALRIRVDGSLVLSWFWFHVAHCTRAVCVRHREKGMGEGGGFEAWARGVVGEADVVLVAEACDSRQSLSLCVVAWGRWKGNVGRFEGGRGGRSGRLVEWACLGKGFGHRESNERNGSRVGGEAVDRFPLVPGVYFALRENKIFSFGATRNAEF